MSIQRWHTQTHTKSQVGQAFERLGKPLSKADLETYMKNVDVDGNGSVDVDEFEHMTRKLLSIACRLPCRTCRLLYQRQVCIWLCACLFLSLSV
jgi:hypothetical protein